MEVYRWGDIKIIIIIRALTNWIPFYTKTMERSLA